MRVGIVDADLLRSKHRFPNLASMKISGYHKSLGDEVTLITDLNPDKFLNHNIVNFKRKYDKIYVSKVFVETSIPLKLLDMDMTLYGGSGFYFSDAERLPIVVESHMPDYHLYDDWIAQQKANGSPDKEFRYYELYSMGYTTRGCVRQCNFCINKHCTKVEKASPIAEFFDIDKRNLCLLDDNVLAYENWREIFEELNTLNKMYEFKQGLDIRMLTEEKAKVLVKSNLNINGLYFAFDDIKEKSIIEEKLKLWREHYRKHTSMYVLCGYDESSNYDDEFWARDIESTLERIKVCMKYNVFPYIMRYKNYKSAPSPYYGMYICLASWCNQKGTIVKYSFTEWVEKMQASDEKINGKTKLYSVKRHYFEYAGKHPDVAYNYFNLNYDDIGEYKYVRDIGANGTEKPFNKPKTVKVVKKKIIEKVIAKKVEIVATSETKKEILVMPDIFQEEIKGIQELPITKSEIKKVIPTVVSKPSHNPNFHEKFVKLNSENIRNSYRNGIDLIILNSKMEVLSETEKLTVLFSGASLKDDSSLFINNIDLKSFNLAREFIEKNTTLKFQEVVNTFLMKNNKEIKSKSYCSRYSMSNDTNIFDTNKKYDKVSLLYDIVSKCSKDGDNVINFFERSAIVKHIGSIYYTRIWSHFDRGDKSSLNYTIKTINGIVKNKNADNKEIQGNENDNTLSDNSINKEIEYYANKRKQS